MIKPRPEPAVDAPSSFDFATASAVRATADGSATPDQQRLAMQWVINAAAAKSAMSFRRDTHEMAFMEGRRFVAKQIVGLLELDMGKLAEAMRIEKDNAR